MKWIFFLMLPRGWFWNLKYSEDNYNFIYLDIVMPLLASCLFPSKLAMGDVWGYKLSLPVGTDSAVYTRIFRPKLSCSFLKSIGLTNLNVQIESAPDKPLSSQTFRFSEWILFPKDKYIHSVGDIWHHDWPVFFVCLFILFYFILIFSLALLHHQTVKYVGEPKNRARTKKLSKRKAKSILLDKMIMVTMRTILGMEIQRSKCDG